MTGLLYDGTTLKNADPKAARTMCEGARARAEAVAPVSPHQDGSELDKAWNVGVAIKEAGDSDPDHCAPAGPAAV